MRECGIESVQTFSHLPPIPNTLQSDEVWMANCQKLMDLTGDLPLGLYETPVPKARNLTPAMVRWVAESGRFNFLKDTSLSVDTLVKKIQTAREVEGSPLK
jgi:4-hydroxy-tetrahydrodipicolinate synthase